MIETVRTLRALGPLSRYSAGMSMQSGAYRDMSVPRPGKNLVLGYVLWFFFGLIGAHRFYLGHIKAGLLFLLGAAVATALSAPDLLITRILGGVVALVVVVFWIIDAIKLPRLIEEAGRAPAATNE